MSEDIRWHDDDAFWKQFQKWGFDDVRTAAAETEVAQIIDLAGLPPSGEILDLACGQGRHAIEFAKRGYRVTGVDRTECYLDTARDRAQEAGADVEFICEDMRVFKRSGAFDAAMNLWTAFGYFEDPEENLQVLRNAREALRPGGVFVLETIGKEIMARTFQPRDWTEKNGVLLIQERKPEKAWAWVNCRWILIEGSTLQEFNVSHWLYSAKELQDMFAEAGFASAEAYGDYAGSAYDENALRLVVVGRA